MSRFSIILDICTRDTRVARWIFIFQFLYILLKWNHFLAFWRTVVDVAARLITDTLLRWCRTSGRLSATEQSFTMVRLYC